MVSKVEKDDPKVPKQGTAKRDGVIKPQITISSKFNTGDFDALKRYESTEVDRRTWLTFVKQIKTFDTNIFFDLLLRSDLEEVSFKLNLLGPLTLYTCRKKGFTVPVELFRNYKKRSICKYTASLWVDSTLHAVKNGGQGKGD